jgi:hypothetical protein
MGMISMKRFRDDADRMNKVSSYFTGLGFEAKANVKDGSIQFSEVGFRRFCEAIAAYVPDCMQYKLPERYRGRYVDFDLDGGAVQHVARNVQVTDIQRGLSARKARQLGKYDIEVDGAHNYLAGSSCGGLIVHNSPEYEPGGETPKFASDLRLRVSKRAIPQGKGPIEEEPCWNEKGVDRYIYTIMRTIKNRGFSPFRETWMRIWFEECGQPGRGIDPVYDTYQYLNMTGQLSERKGYYSINVDGFKGDKRLTWQQFKALILDPEAKKDAGTDIRQLLRNQFGTNEAFERYFGEFGGKIGERAGEEATEAEAKDLKEETEKAKEAEKGLETEPKKQRRGKKSLDAEDVGEK